jgi:prepilin-type N-terminal cleavage/methylation domain-containing protein
VFGLLREREEGFTLVELLVVMLIFGVIGGVVTTSLVRGLRTSHHVQSRIEAMAELQRGAERIARELRAACPVVELGASTVEVTVLRDGARWDHRFEVEAGDLNHSIRDASGSVTQPARLLVGDVEAGTRFEFRDQKGELVTDNAKASSVRSARVVLVRSVAAQPDLIEVETQVSLRNGGRACE